MKATYLILFFFILIGLSLPLMSITQGQNANNPIFVTQDFYRDSLKLDIRIFQENPDDPFPLINFDFFFENDSFYFSKLIEMDSTSVITEINLPPSFNESLNLKIVSKINGNIFTDERAIPNSVSTISSNITTSIKTSRPFNPYYDPLSVILIIILILFFIGLFGGAYYVYIHYSQKEVIVPNEDISESTKPNTLILPVSRPPLDVIETPEWKKTDFHSFEEFQKSKELGVENRWELNLIKQFDCNNYQEAFKLLINSLEQEFLEMFKIKNEWSLHEISDQLSIPLSHLPSIIDELFDKYYFDADLDLNSRTIHSYYPLQTEIDSVLSYVKKVRDNVHIQINQMVEITQLDKKQSIRILKDLISSLEIKGEYLELEGVFIKHEITVGEQFVGEFTCQICKSIKHVSPDKLALCPYCKNPFHKGHLLEWLKTKGTCPICQEKVREEEL